MSNAEKRIKVLELREKHNVLTRTEERELEALLGALKCLRCKDTGIEPGTIVISPGFGFNSLDPDPLGRGSYVPCKACGGVVENEQKE